jgi:hypothetical protein
MLPRTINPDRNDAMPAQDVRQARNDQISPLAELRNTI